jgi:hypothetical protein
MSAKQQPTRKQTGFNFGHNIEPSLFDYRTKDPPTYELPEPDSSIQRQSFKVSCDDASVVPYVDRNRNSILCSGLLVCNQCGEACTHDFIRAAQFVDVDLSVYPTKKWQEYSESYENGEPLFQQETDSMDLSKQVSGKKPQKFDKRDWLAPEDLPAKGSARWKVDGARDAKKNKTGILVYVDLSRGKLKRVISLRKNFTLDAFVDALGAHSEKWAGKMIDLERGGSDGQYVNVSQ